MQVLLIGGAGHSGSTLLGLILGGLPGVFYAGEAKKSQFLGNLAKPEKKRVCKVCGAGCVVWTEAEQLGASDAAKLYPVLRKITGVSTICDSSKDLGWQSKQIELARERNEGIGYIWLIRDGRAVVNSRARKYPNIALETHVDEWREQMESVQKNTIELQAQGITVSTVHYEELAQHPVSELRRLCHRFGLTEDQSAVSFWLHAQHPLGGNNGTQSALRAPGAEIRLDERWRHELDEASQEIFEKLAGAFNRDLLAIPS